MKLSTELGAQAVGQPKIWGESSPPNPP